MAKRRKRKNIYVKTIPKIGKRKRRSRQIGGLFNFDPNNPTKCSKLPKISRKFKSIVRGIKNKFF